MKPSLRALRFWNHFDNDVKKCFIAIFLQSENYIQLPDAPRHKHIARGTQEIFFFIAQSKWKFEAKRTPAHFDEVECGLCDVDPFRSARRTRCAHRKHIGRLAAPDVRLMSGAATIQYR
ncbi:hypothetical protein [Xanthomonas graminis]|uniref:hypothetical protein n=1 Tax=Xanthomonas graminis TaxID=3390026 RepID=UPI0011151679|nr:hypothetical protein [Xanthomonas translucens]UKE53861.1 hypothetical protein KFS84_16755 [Xanthomonas translucens pv. graminis]WIH08178.1 hypothetical protein KM579_17315 [Xanthomonas translucens pv. graminis]WIH13069.1 hypothetical protein KM563_04705 [Xanthomonas translucens pv. graminis]